MLKQAITFPGISLNPFQRFAPTVQYSTVQYSTVQHSTVQYSTVQYSTVQYSTVQVPTKLEYDRKTKGVEIEMNLGMCLPEGINTDKQDKFNCRPADPDGRSVYGVGLRTLDSLDRGFESR